MEHQLWKAIVEWLLRCGKPRRPRDTFSDAEIAKIFFWAALHDRPMSWACEQTNWPLHERRWAKPSQSRLSRRLRSKSVCQLLERLEHELLRPQHDLQLVWMIDGKPLTISGCSKDRQAGYGRAAGCKARGYKIHVLCGADGSIAEWRLAPMNKDERTIAARILRTTSVRGYVLGDANYDSNPLHEICEQRGNLQLVTPRRYGSQCGFGNRKQTKSRMHSAAMLETPHVEFGRDLFEQRTAIERLFGNLTNWGGGLTHLPPWIRTYRRVHRWVQAKLIATRVRRELRLRT